MTTLSQQVMLVLATGVSIVSAAGSVATGQFEWLNSANAEATQQGLYNPYRDFNTWVNRLLMPDSVVEYVESSFQEDTAYYVNCYVRDLVMGCLVYWVTAGLWHFVIYSLKGDELFTKKGRPLPTTATMVESMQLAQSSIFLYAALPVLSEYLIEKKLTRVYFYIDEVGGWPQYFAYLLAYVVFFEVGIYWVHRTLHTNKFLYKYVHGLHHKFNRINTLTPWTSIAFNPIDGLLQASPYVIGLFFIPVHFFTHIVLLFFSGVWATNIHDAVPSDWEPIMGAKYHTVHHTHFHYNFGQWFTFCDRIWGSLRTPEEISGDQYWSKKKSPTPTAAASTPSKVPKKQTKTKKAD